MLRKSPSILERLANLVKASESLADAPPAMAACRPAPAFRPATAVATSSHMVCCCVCLGFRGDQRDTGASRRR